MSNDAYADAFLRDILAAVKTVAVVGASDKETRLPTAFSPLLARGYHVIGVNPGLAGKSVHGAAFFKTLADVPGPIDMVDIFRNSAAAGGVVNEALALDPRPWALWMQLGVRIAVPKSNTSAWGSGKRSDTLLTRVRQRLRLRDRHPQNDHRECLMQ